MDRLSVVIPNHNYEQFVAAAIDSALALDWPDVEVIVVDDGSTDGSLEVINRYRDRVEVVATENRTHRRAVNLGFEKTTGDVVIFLDSDDVLPAALPSALDRACRPGVSKVQFAMQRIDETGAPVGRPFPTYRTTPSPHQVRDWLLRTSAYPTPPGSGNAYARWFLDRVMPLDNTTGDFADSGLLATAPLLGDVVTCPGVRVGYRRHPSNDSHLLGDPRRFSREVARAVARWDFARRVTGQTLDPDALRRSRELLQFRVAALVYDGRAPQPEDSRARMLRDVVRSPFQPGPESLRRRVLITGWGVTGLLLPPVLARRVVTLRFGRRR